VLNWVLSCGGRLRLFIHASRCLLEQLQKVITLNRPVARSRHNIFLVHDYLQHLKSILA
jgi:hypothetical protein